VNLSLWERLLAAMNAVAIIFVEYIAIKSFYDRNPNFANAHHLTRNPHLATRTSQRATLRLLSACSGWQNGIDRFF